MPENSNIPLLLISYLFPPSGGIGVQRALSLAKYLPRCGFDVHVLSARNAAGPVKDTSLLKHVPACVSTHQAFTPEIPFAVRQQIWRLLGSKQGGSRPAAASSPGSGGLKSAVKSLAQRVLCPEPEIVWVPFAVRKSRDLIRRAGIRVVMITAPPFSSFVIGAKLKAEFPDLKVVADFRDEWLDFYLNEFDFQKGPHTRRRAEEIERETVTKSDLVVAVTEASLRAIRNRYPKEADMKFALIHNGYDPEVVSAVERPRRPDGKVVVVHMGTVYKTASPQYYLEALDGLPDQLRRRFETRFVGHISQDQRGVFEDRRSAIHAVGFLPQDQAIREVANADFVLLTMTNDISLPGKLFEYLALGKPILALAAKNSEVHRIISATNSGFCADFRDLADIRAALSRLATDSAAGFRPNWDAIRKFARPYLTAAYADRIRELFHSP